MNLVASLLCSFSFLSNTNKKHLKTQKENKPDCGRSVTDRHGSLATKTLSRAHCKHKLLQNSYINK